MKERPRQFNIENMRNRDQITTIESIIKFGWENDVEVYDDEGNLVAITSRRGAKKLAENGNLG